MKAFSLVAIAVLFLSMHSVTQATGRVDAASQQEWNFRVLLDGKDVGYHNFYLLQDDDTRQLTSEAEFRIKFLFITAFSYEHVNRETWRDDCLQSIESRTDANGRQFQVRGERTDNGLSITSNDDSHELPGCVKTFAYWNPDILQEPALMNSQTGEVLTVDIKPLAREILTIRGLSIPAQRYRLIARNMQVDLWYSDNDEWLALESTVKAGRKLRYELT